MKQALRNLLLATLPAVLVSFALLELFFRFVIPAAQVPLRTFDAAEGIVRYSTDGPREGTFTRGRFAEVRGRWRVNSDGWNSEIDYARANGARSKPLVAVIGDSFVNAFQVDPDENLAGVLRRMLGERAEVYAFGSPGAPLSHYLQLSRYVDRTFDPRIVVFNVVHNDFHASLRRLVAEPQFLQLDIEEGELVEAPPAIAELPAPAWWSHTATGRYLMITLQSHLLAGTPPDGRRFAANVPVDVLDANRELVRRATEFVVSRIVEENAGRTILFMMDAPRLDLYAGNPAGSPVFWLNELLAETCRRHGVPFIDLSDAFSEEFRRTGERFESAIDAHWNEIGHREAARALARALDELGVLQPEPSRSPP